MTVKIESTSDSAEDVSKVLGTAKLPGGRKNPDAESKTSSKIVPPTETVNFKPSKDPEPEETETEEPEESEEDLKVQAEESKNNQGGEKKKGGFQKKIDKMTKAQKELEAKYNALQADYEREKSSRAGPAAEPEAKVEPLKIVPKADEPKPENFKSNAEYVKALAKYEWDEYAKADTNKKNIEKMQAEREKMISDHNSRVMTYKESVPDFEEVLHEVDNIPFTPQLADVLLNHDRGPELMYALAKDPENYERISKLPIRSIEREIGKLEARLETSATSNETQGNKTKTSAPRPIKPVAATSPPAKKLGWYEGMPLKDYKKAREQGLI